MGAWIEILRDSSFDIHLIVAPHDGCVDWNFVILYTNNINIVAPHDGCVDWNIETVGFCKFFRTSHPTMGAWIEIFCFAPL